jgi:RNA-directed DNA polymerase
MTKAPIGLQDLRRRIYVKAKAEPSWRFWGLYVHVCKRETLLEAYRLAKANNGAPGIDGVTFEAVEAQGVDQFVEQLREELVRRTYRPLRVRKVGIPKEGGKVRNLSIPAIRDRVVQGALKLILGPIFEADFQPGSFGYRPKKTPHEAIQRVADAILQYKTYVIDLDLRSYFDTVRQHILLGKVARRVGDEDVLRMLRLILRSSGKRGVPQGGVISPLLSNVYLNEVDNMLERAKEVTRDHQRSAVEYARFADDLVVLVNSHPRHRWLRKVVEKRLREELAKLEVEVNEEKSRIVDLAKGESFGFLGFDFRRVRSRAGRWMPLRTPQRKKRTALLRKLKDCFRRFRSRSTRALIAEINWILRGWVAYFAVGHSSRCFSFIRNWVEQKIRRHLARARQRQGFGWKRWSRRWLYDALGLFDDYYVRYPRSSPKAPPTR